MGKRQIIPKWRPALELLADSVDGCTEALLFAHGFTSATIAGLVDSGLAAATTKCVLAGQRYVAVTGFKITARGRATLERVSLPVPNERGRPMARRRRD
jgi:hypothetical protein